MGIIVFTLKLFSFFCLLCQINNKINTQTNTKYVYLVYYVRMNKLNELLAELGWSQRKLARVCRVEPNTANRWANDVSETPHVVLLYLQLLVDIKKAVGE